MTLSERIQLLITRNNISQSELEKTLGFGKGTISKWKGKTAPSADKLQLIADYFGVTIDYLMTGNKSANSEPQLNARDEKDIQKQLEIFREQLMSQEGLMFDGDPASPEAVESILSAMEIGMAMAKKKNKERFTPKKYRKRIEIMDIPEIAKRLIIKYKTRNPFEILKCLGVILVIYPLEGVNGFYQHFQRCDIIYIDERLTELQKMLVCAHELGHMLRHKTANAVFMDTRTQFTTQKYEIEADRFAVNLLISDDDIEENIDFTTYQFSRLFGYDKKLIELRLKDFI